jgi:TPR repeat protein
MSEKHYALAAEQFAQSAREIEAAAEDTARRLAEIVAAQRELCRALEVLRDAMAPAPIEYSIGYARARELEALLDRFGAGRPEYAAIERLQDGRGTRQDVELAAHLYEQAGEGAGAAELRRSCLGPQAA